MSDFFSAPLALAGTAFVIGFTGAAAPGPFLTVTIARTIRSGRASALLMLVGHALLEAVLIAGLAFGLQDVLRHPMVMRVLALAGGAFLMWMAVDLLVGSIKGTISADLHAAEEVSSATPVAHGVLVSLSNPYFALWWVTVGAALASQGLAMGPQGVAAFYVGHEAADFAWYGGVVWAVSRGRHLLSDGVYRLIMGALGALLVGLSVRFLWMGFSPLLGL